MSTNYVTGQNEMLDKICADFYGADAVGATEATLAANPGLADLGPILPVNTNIVLPAQTPAPALLATINLWD